MVQTTWLTYNYLVDLAEHLNVLHCHLNVTTSETYMAFLYVKNKRHGSPLLLQKNRYLTYI